MRGQENMSTMLISELGNSVGGDIPEAYSHRLAVMFLQVCSCSHKKKKSHTVARRGRESASVWVHKMSNTEQKP